MTNSIWALLFYLGATGVLNLLLSRRSQIDHWAEANPRVAGLLKLLRMAGLDPWLGVQAASLIVRGRLPAGLQAPAAPEGAVRPPKNEGSPTAPGASLALLWVGAAALGLAGAQSCASAAPAPCSKEDFVRGQLALIVAECSAKRAQACPDAGTDDPCPPVDEECDKRIDARCSGGGK